jgi:ankyrin repeat protein
MVDCNEASLHQAAAKQCLGRLEQLLTGRPGDIELRDPRGLTPLATAVLADRLESAELLLKARADVNALVRFAQGTAPRVGGLAKAQTPELAEFSTPLILAKSAPMATLLLRHRADPRLKNDYGWSAIFYFTRNGTPDMIDILIAGGANINDTADVDPSHAGSTPLMWAAFMNLLPQLDALLRHRPRLDIRDRAGNTALDYATRFKHTEAIARLKAAATAP